MFHKVISKLSDWFYGDVLDAWYDYDEDYFYDEP